MKSTTNSRNFQHTYAVDGFEFDFSWKKKRKSNSNSNKNINSNMCNSQSFRWVYVINFHFYLCMGWCGACVNFLCGEHIPIPLVARSTLCGG